MFQIFKKPSKTDWILIGIYWAIAYFYIIPVFFKQGRFLETLFLSFIEIIARTFLALTIVFLIYPKSNSIKNVVFSALKGTFIISLLTPFFMIGDAYYNKTVIDWSFTSFAKNVLSEAQEIGILCTLLAMKQFYNLRLHNQKLEKLNVENQLKALNNQVSPHFLFNNLNVLSGLITQNPVEAQEYLNRLALIYRHLITNANNEIVLLEDELRFSDDYIYLLKKRFENAYVFTKEATNLESYNKFVPTCSLQSVLENIIKHNKGDKLNPLKTTIQINETEIIITNQKKLKEPDYETTGFGLINLKNRYKLLGNRQLQHIETSETYTVKLPLLNAINYK